MATQNLALVGMANGLSAIVSYTIRSCKDNAVQYVGTNADDTLSAPRLLDVKLDIKAPGVVGNDRANVSFKRVVLDENNIPSTGSVTVGISVPRVPEWTVEQTVSMLKQASDYLGGLANGVIEGQTNTSTFPTSWAQMLIP